MPGKQPVHSINASVGSVPSFQLYLQLYREQHASFVERAVNASISKRIAVLFVNDIFIWLHAQPVLLVDRETAIAYLTNTFDELINELLRYEKKGRATNIIFHVLAAKHPDYFSAAVNKLPSPYCTITRLYLQGLSEKEIATQVNIAYSIVKRRLSFSLFLLKTQFAKKPKAPV